jgi:hypothetical protein
VTANSRVNEDIGAYMSSPEKTSAMAAYFTLNVRGRKINNFIRVSYEGLEPEKEGVGDSERERFSLNTLCVTVQQITINQISVGILPTLKKNQLKFYYLA